MYPHSIPDPPKKEEKKEEKKEAPAPKKDGPPPPTELKVVICCEGCAANLYEALKDVDEVTDVTLNLSAGKIAVHGKAKPEKILKAARKLKPGAELIAAKKK